jgi:hypothetical protein
MSSVKQLTQVSHTKYRKYKIYNASEVAAQTLCWRMYQPTDMERKAKRGIGEFNENKHKHTII